jgi:hypothetical protein
MNLWWTHEGSEHCGWDHGRSGLSFLAWRARESL